MRIANLDAFLKLAWNLEIVITDEVEELVTHNIFYTAITRAREKLKIYWTPEVEEKVINRIKPRDISKDVELLKHYLTDKQQNDSLDFLLWNKEVQNAYQLQQAMEDANRQKHE